MSDNYIVQNFNKVSSNDNLKKATMLIEEINNCFKYDRNSMVLLNKNSIKNLLLKNQQYFPDFKFSLNKMQINNIMDIYINLLIFGYKQLITEYRKIILTYYEEQNSYLELNQFLEITSNIKYSINSDILATKLLEKLAGVGNHNKYQSIIDEEAKIKHFRYKIGALQEIREGKMFIMQSIQLIGKLYKKIRIELLGIIAKTKQIEYQYLLFEDSVGEIVTLGKAIVTISKEQIQIKDINIQEKGYKKNLIRSYREITNLIDNFWDNDFKEKDISPKVETFSELMTSFGWVNNKGMVQVTVPFYLNKFKFLKWNILDL